jgi:predicted Zn-dependent peptidase
LTVGSGLDKKRFQEAVKAIISELKKVAKSGVTAEELARAKDHIRGKTMLAFEDSATQAEWYGKQWLFQRKMETPAERMKRFDKVTRADVHKIARTIFAPDRMASAIIGPFGKKEQAAKLIKW